MTSQTLSEEQIKALDFQTNQLYASFRRTVETQSHQDAVWNKELFGAFEKSLKTATHYSLFMDWNRDTARTPIFDKYLLHYALGNIPSIMLEKQIMVRENGHELEAKVTEVTVDTLKQTIDNNKAPYSRIQSLAMSLADAHDFAGIVEALGYVRISEYYRQALKKNGIPVEEFGQLNRREKDKLLIKLQRKDRISELNQTLVQIISDEQVMCLTRGNDSMIEFARTMNFLGSAEERYIAEIQGLRYNNLCLYQGKLYVVGGFNYTTDERLSAELVNQPPNVSGQAIPCYLEEDRVKFSKKDILKNQIETITLDLAKLMCNFLLPQDLERALKQLK